MDRINFDAEFISIILNGEKKTTIRRGIRRYPLGKVVELTVNNEPVALAKVKKVVVKRISEINDEDARIDGFKSKDELLSALKKIYGDLSDSEFVTIVHFEVLKS
ncbi:MAG: ASCH domain-containing protein [Archaeoglobaceae archaeon]|nr:ASCH domain-containing protein [Archaeoglobaceae archaeon]MDW8117369.1 ASCH domain-containing protein [Archaeoglobaceae archaeon]